MIGTEETDCFQHLTDGRRRDKPIVGSLFAESDFNRLTACHPFILWNYSRCRPLYVW